jgi:8-oxo-dGTP pyrophosphatase MutT (NUDIX family)
MMDADDFRERLRHGLALPARHVQRGYAPELAYGRHAGPPWPDVRQGAVLVLFFPDTNDWHAVLTVRTSHLSSHAGQVSFPGGRIEPDETAEEAALREYHEELGSPGRCEILGRLPDANVFASNFLVTPVVVLAESRPEYVPSTEEVAAVMEVSLTQLQDRALRGSHEIVRGPLRFLTPHLEVAGRLVWGATWIILGELLERLKSSR